MFIHKIDEVAIYIGFGFLYNRGRIRIVLHIASFRGDGFALSPSIRAKELGSASVRRIVIQYEEESTKSYLLHEAR